MLTIGSRLSSAAVVTMTLFALGAGPATAEEGRWSFTPSFNDFGTTGLVQMPNGRMAPEGEFTVGVSRTDPYTRYFVTSQVLPWLQATFRYTDIGYEPYGIVDTQTYKDKSFDLKVRLVEEGPVWPEVAVGLRDIGGTGIFSSEYIAASRRYYDWDFTVGAAWGNMGSRGHLPNPLALVSNRFKARDVSEGTGTLNDTFFRGEDIGLFAGVEWDTPIEGLRVKLEYDANDYQSEFRGTALEVDAPFNGEIGYQPFPWLDLSLGFERGNTVMFGGKLRSNFNTAVGVPDMNEVPPLPAEQAVREGEMPPPPAAMDHRAMDSAVIQASVDTAFDVFQDNGVEVVSLDLVPPSVSVTLADDSSQAPDALARAGLAIAQMPTVGGVERIIFRSSSGQTISTLDASRLLQRGTFLDVEQATADTAGDVAKRIFEGLEYYGFKARRVALEGDRVVVVFSQGAYGNLAKAFGRVARAAALATTPAVREIEVIETAHGLAVGRAVFVRDDVIAAARHQGSVDEVWLNVETAGAYLPEGLDWTYAEGSYPDYSWGLVPKLRQTIGGPDNFYLYQIYGQLNGSIQPVPGLNLEGSVGVNIVDNFDDFTYDPPSNLPRVRTDVRKYLVNRDIWIDDLHIDYMQNFAPDWYGRVSAGLFEMMYGGVAGEVLYRPTGKRWAVGLDLNHVWQRDFDGGLGFRDYDVTTGHLTWYQDLPYYDLEGSVSVGRYLAGDIGGTFSLGRSFDNGIKIGGWVTKTDVSAEDFGEGSFDKGFYITIPFGLFSTSPTKATSSIGYRPLFSDGGQKVVTPLPLYSVTSGGRSATTGWRNGMD
jgi:hypothetical protein